jgi:uncharacterized protein (UPF0332 family)
LTPEAAGHLAKARQCLDRARIILAAGVAEDAGRNAYLAAFHAAQALIAARTGKDTKTHKGVHAEFARLTKDEPRLNAEMRRFLPQAYDMKAIADYELGTEASVPLNRASAAIATAEQFIGCIASDGMTEIVCERLSARSPSLRARFKARALLFINQHNFRTEQAILVVGTALKRGR